MKTAQRSFAYGEVAPALYARPDLAMYSQALRTLRNAYVMRAGGVQSRPGTLRGITTRQQDASVRLVPCVFSEEQDYMLEIGDGYIRVLKRGDVYRVASSGNWADDTAYTVGIVVSTSATDHFLCLQDHTSVAADNEPLSGTDWEDYWHQMEEDPTGNVELVWPTSYTQDQISTLRFAQTPGAVTIVHPDHPPAQLIRVSANQWALKNIDFASPSNLGVPQNLAAEIDETGVSAWSGSSVSYSINQLVTNDNVVYRCISAHTSGATSEPGTGATWETYWAVKGSGGDDGGFWYVVTAVDADGVETTQSDPVKTDSSQNPLSPTWRNVTLTWDQVTGAEQYYVYRSQNSAFGYRRLMSVAPGIVGGIAEDTNPLSTAYISNDSPPSPIFFFDEAGEYPSTVSFYQQRLLLAASQDDPDTVWASVTGKPFDFNVRFPLQDDDAISWRQLSRQAVEIRHLVEIGRRLVAFTNLGEYIVTGADDGVLRPGEINPTLYSYNGANYLDPIVIDNTALYVQARGSRVLRISPEYQDEPANSDLSILATHLLEGYEIVSWTYQEVPNSLVWMVRNDGVLLCMAYVREAGITAWSKCDTNGLAESVCCVPEGGEDVLYLVALRDGVRRIERMVNRLAENPICLDDAYSVELETEVDVTNLPSDETYKYAEVRLKPPYVFDASDVGSWIQILRDGAAWISWEIVEILAGGTAKIRIALADAPLEYAGVYPADEWVYVAANVEPDPLVVVDDPNAPVAGAVYVTDGAYDGISETTSATVTATNPVFSADSVGSKLLLGVNGVFDAWDIDSVDSAMIATITHDGDLTSVDGTYDGDNWIYRPKELDEYPDGEAVVVLDGEYPPSQTFIGADIVGAKMYTTDSTQRQQGTAQLYYSDDNVRWFAGPTGYATNGEDGDWDGTGLGSCGIKSWIGTTVTGKWVDVQPGISSTIGLKSDGTLWGWGENTAPDDSQDPSNDPYVGLLGLGSSYGGSSVPVRIGQDLWESIAVGSRHFAAIRSDGTLWTSGRNANGQLGLGDTNQRSVLTQVGSDSDWVKVFAGAWNTFAIRSNGTLWASGWNEFGQLGLNNVLPCTSMTQVGSDEWEMVSPSSVHTIGIKSNGTLWACGNGAEYPAMGLGPSSFISNQITFIQVGSASDWEHVATAEFSVARKTNGTLWTSGTAYGFSEGTYPTGVQYFTQMSGSDWVYSTVATDVAFAIKSDGTAWSWGANSWYMTGLGEGAGDVWLPEQIGVAEDWLLVRGGSGGDGSRTTVAFGIRDTLTSFGNDGELYVWGTRRGEYNYDNFGVDTQAPFEPSYVYTPQKVYGVVAVIGQKRYWRYVAGSGHPTISRLWLVDRAGVEYPYGTYSDDNCIGDGDVPGDDPSNPGEDIPETTPGGGGGGGTGGPLVPYNRLVVGLPYNVDIETLDVDGPQRSVKNDPVRVGEVFIWLDKSGSFYVGPKATANTSDLELYTPMNDEGYSIGAGQLYSGVAPVTLRTTYTRNGRIFIRQPDPKPLTVTAIIAEGLINGRG